MRYPRAATIAVAAVLAVTGCAPTTGGDRATETSGSNAQSAPAAKPPKPKPEPPTPGELAFGDSFEWQDGLQVTVSRPREFQPARWAAFDKGPAYVRFTVKVVNGTKRPYDPSSNWYGTVQSGNREASTIFDTDHGLDGAPMTSILPGREGVWDEGYTVLDPTDLVYEVAPSWDHQTVFFVTR